MALEKELIVRGVPCNYWRVIGFEARRFEKSVRVEYGLYYNSAAQASSEANVMLSREFSLDGNFLNYQLTDVTAKMSSVMLTVIEEVFMELAVAEAAKPDDDDFKNHALAWFADAVQV